MLHRLARGYVVIKKSLPPELAGLLSALQAADDPRGPTPTEGIRLLKAFLVIKESSLRAGIIDLVEKIAAATGVQQKRQD